MDLANISMEKLFARDTVLELQDLAKINGAEFFEETVITEGVKT